MKRGHGFLLSHLINCDRCLLRSFQTKTFPLSQVLQIDAIIFNFDLFLNLDFITFNFAPNPYLSILNEDQCFVPISLQLQLSVLGFTNYVCYQNDMNNFAAYCCFHYVMQCFPTFFVIRHTFCIYKILRHNNSLL